MHRHSAHVRRYPLVALSLAAAIPLLVRCSSPTSQTPAGLRPIEHVPPQRLHTEVTRASDGSFLRSFSGAAAPQNLEFLDAARDTRRRVHDLFPNDHCPFAIDTAKQLGPEGYALTVVDRTLAGLAPTALDAVWPLNMVPFGVAIDGAIIDPSGPWYDGGPADPNNPFDRACSGWEYDPIFPSVADLVGVSSEVRGHVQPGPGGRPGSAGLFHYHGTPAVMLDNLRGMLTEDERRQALVVGYSADGFWILDSVIPAPATVSGKRLHLFSGYVLRQGTRAAVPHTNPALVPAGTYDGTFVQDWRFDPEEKRLLIESALRDRGEYYGLGRTEIEAGRAEFAVLDERNGLVTDRILLRDAPERTYVYVLTPDMPQLPRWFAFEPSPSFRQNLIPFEAPAGIGPPGRRQLYQACSADLADVHRWSGREPY
jgi:hypothetical protein